MTMYRGSAQPRPPAGVDARILSAAQATARQSTGRRDLLFAGTLAATMIVAFGARLLITEPLPPADSPEFGISEGQSHDYLIHFDPLTTGPGSQEGLP